MGRYKGTEHVVSKGEFLVLLLQFQGDCWESSLLSKALNYEGSLHRTAKDKNNEQVSQLNYLCFYNWLISSSVLEKSINSEPLDQQHCIIFTW